MFDLVNYIINKSDNDGRCSCVGGGPSNDMTNVAIM